MNEKSRRIQRVEKEIRETASTYLMEQQSGSSEDLVALTKVFVSPDLRNAKIFVCVIGKEVVDEDTLQTLQSHAPEIQKRINNRLRMKFCPRVQFYNDDSVRMMAKIDRILKEDSGSHE
ncbi:MAG: 30S ribosome-binding factor RbfA [Bdellovibrionales bacterium]|nr:30S ribosome-binding factor RbfA [Bdellovibrionales bacterium]